MPIREASLTDHRESAEARQADDHQQANSAGMDRFDLHLGVEFVGHREQAVDIVPDLGEWQGALEGSIDRERSNGVTLLQDTCENHRLALPNKLFEYIVAGVPVVASALPETERIVSAYGIGWCAAPDDPVGLAKVLRRALSERGNADRQNRLAVAAAELRWSREQTRLIDLYSALSARLNAAG